ncbi:MAG: septal ring lytic transglycosylase RlpA family protein [Gammaproteobacteria bacterium]|nr:septal ring lytic transglycosylase RlpA family protein [Gammaproteobacteria bacterium]
MVNHIHSYVRHALIILLASILSGCSLWPTAIFEKSRAGDGAPVGGMDVSKIKNAVPRAEPRSRSGNPSSYTVLGRTYQVMRDSTGFSEQGIASWYGTKFHGRRTSSGETYDMYAMTAAHKSLPLPTYVQVTNLRNGRAVIVKVNDRGPFHDNRVIDLSYAAATKLGITASGTGLVEVRALDPSRGQPRPTRNNLALPGRDADIYLQVGAFTDQNNAEQLSQRLQNSMSKPVRIQTAVGYDKTIYRVQVGPIQNVEQADATSMQLGQLGIQDMRLIIE